MVSYTLLPFYLPVTIVGGEMGPRAGVNTAEKRKTPVEMQFQHLLVWLVLVANLEMRESVCVRSLEG
jgi:hypothetical protein